MDFRPTDTNLVDPATRGVDQDSKHSAHLRWHGTTRDVYQNPLKKRVTARVFKNLDLGRGSVTLRVQEPARMPVIASGLRVMCKSLIRFGLAVLVAGVFAAYVPAFILTQTRVTR